MIAVESGIPPSVLSELEAAVGSAHISIDVSDRLANARGVWPVELKAARRVLSGDESVAFSLPGCVVRPESTEQVSAVLRIAQENRVRVIPFGGGSGIVGGTSAVQDCISLDTKRLHRVWIDPVSMVAHAQPGIFGVDLERQLNAAGLSLGHFPQSLHSSTIGGWVATRASGTFSTLYGNIEDMVIGLEVVLPGGDVVRTRTTPRSATGPNLAELFLGSEGTLGVVTEVALSLHPLPDHQVWSSFAFSSFQAGLEAVRAMVQSGARPGVVRLYDPGETAHKFSKFGLSQGSCVLVLVYEGAVELAQANAKIGRRACLAAGGTETGRDPAHFWWQTRFDTSGLVDALARPGGIADAIEVAALWKDLPGVYASMMRAAEHHGAGAFAHVSHAYPAGGGLYVIFAATASDDETAVTTYQRIVDEMLRACLEASGSISHHHGIGRGKSDLMPIEHGETGMAILREVKRTVDPHGIMNPGVLGLGG
jgi:alkyldihydroxyacetonephosphate synthase